MTILSVPINGMDIVLRVKTPYHHHHHPPPTVPNIYFFADRTKTAVQHGGFGEGSGSSARDRAITSRWDMQQIVVRRTSESVAVQS